MKLNKITYKSLSAHHKASYNYFKIASILSEYGYLAMSRSSDCQSGEFIAMHIDGKHMIRVQPATRLSFWKKHLGNKVYVIFHKRGKWYFYPHDKMYREVKAISNFERTKAFRKRGRYVFVGGPSGHTKRLLKKYELRESRSRSAQTGC